MPIVVRNSRNEASQRLAEVFRASKNKSVRLKLHISFYDPEIQRYRLFKGDNVTFDASSLRFALELPAKLREWLSSQNKPEVS
jgi:hypothetical protein